MPVENPATFDGHRPRIRIPVLREILDRVLYILRGLVPRIGPHALRRINAHRERLFPVRQVDPRRVPHKHRRRAPGHIPRVVHVKMPGQRAVGFRAAGRIVHFFRLANVNRLVAVARLGKTLDLRFGQHIFRIHQLARTGNDHLRRHRHVVVEVPIFQIKLRADVRQRVPAAQIVIHRHPRIPLRHVIDLALL